MNKSLFVSMLKQLHINNEEEVLHYGRSNVEYVETYENNPVKKVTWLEPTELMWERLRLQTGSAKNFKSDIGVVELSNETNEQKNIFRFEDYLRKNLVSLDLMPISMIVIESPKNVKDVIEGFGTKVWNDYPNLNKVLVLVYDINQKFLIEELGFRQSTIIGLVEKESSPKWVLYER